MGFLQDLAAATIRKQVIATLRAECPAALRQALEALLADEAAVKAIQKLVMAALAAKKSLTADSFAALKLQPELAGFLAQVANAKMPH